MAHPRRLSCTKPTRHQPPRSRAAGVTAASLATSTHRGQALPPDLRPTRPTLYKPSQPINDLKNE